MTKYRLKSASLLTATLLILGLGCGGGATPIPTNTEDPLATPTPVRATQGEVLQSLTSQVILPGYKAAADGMALLNQSVDALCSDPSEAGLDAARDAWRAARQAWLRTESYRFGPAMDRRSISVVDWWPIDPEKIDRNLARDEEVTAEQVTEFLPATQRGLSAAEYLLFGEGSTSLSDGSDPQRCSYVQAVGVATSGEVAGILEDWQGTEEASGYASYFDGTASLSLIDSDAEAEIVRSLVFQVRTIANMRLGAGLGIDTEPDASAIPEGGAGNSQEDLLNQLDGIAAVYRGADGGMGLSARVTAVSPETDARMLAAIESTMEAARSLDGSIIDQLQASPAQVRALYDNMKELQRVLNTEIVSLLGVSVGFSDTDGDS